MITLNTVIFIGPYLYDKNMDVAKQSLIVWLPIM